MTQYGKYLCVAVVNRVFWNNTTKRSPKAEKKKKQLLFKPAVCQTFSGILIYAFPPVPCKALGCLCQASQLMLKGTTALFSLQNYASSYSLLRWKISSIYYLNTAFLNLRIGPRIKHCFSIANILDRRQRWCTKTFIN